MRWVCAGMCVSTCSWRSRALSLIAHCSVPMRGPLDNETTPGCKHKCCRSHNIYRFGLSISRGMHEYGMFGNVLGVTTTIPTGGRLDMTLPPLRAVLYGPVRRPPVSRVDLTVTVFRSQIFGPFIAHYDNLRPSQVSHMAFSVDRHHGKDAPLAGSARGYMWNEHLC